jgi:hypothetical protein
MNKKSMHLMSLLGIIIFISSACYFPGNSAVQLDPAAQTAVAETAVALAVQTQLIKVTVELPTPPAVESPLPETPTQSPEPTATETLTPEPTFTSPPLNPTISVSKNTNCRTGNAKNYDYSGALLVGEQAEVLARDSGNYWYVRLPSGITCWLWGEYATITGDTSRLPVFTPPPSPTPSPEFTFSFKSMGVGPGYQCFMVDVKNTGSLTWESFTLNFHDLTHGDTATTTGNEFIGYDQWCGVTGSRSSLMTGETGTASVKTFLAHDPSGDNLEFTLKLCSKNGLTGNCLTKSISITY